MAYFDYMGALPETLIGDRLDPERLGRRQVKRSQRCLPALLYRALFYFALTLNLQMLASQRTSYSGMFL